MRDVTIVTDNAEKKKVFSKLSTILKLRRKLVQSRQQRQHAWRRLTRAAARKGQSCLVRVRLANGCAALNLRAKR